MERKKRIKNEVGWEGTHTSGLHLTDIMNVLLDESWWWFPRSCSRLNILFYFQTKKKSFRKQLLVRMNQPALLWRAGYRLLGLQMLPWLAKLMSFHLHPKYWACRGQDWPPDWTWGAVVVALTWCVHNNNLLAVGLAPRHKLPVSHQSTHHLLHKWCSGGGGWWWWRW